LHNLQTSDNVARIIYNFRLVPNLVLVILLIRLTIRCVLYGTLLIPE
jgi:hypothetical protein